MLTSVLRAFVKNPIKESFYGESKKKKTINVLTIFFISHKSDVTLICIYPSHDPLLSNIIMP